MRVFIPTKGRYDTISTHEALSGKGVECKVIVHSREERDRYVDAGRVQKRDIVVSGARADTFGLTRQREFVCRELAEQGEWFVFADDNIKELTAVDREHYGEDQLSVEDKSTDWRKVFLRKLTGTEFARRVVPGTVAEAERVGAAWCGFAVVDNFFFRSRKFRHVGYVIGKLTVQKNVDIRFDHTISMEDFDNTAWQLYRRGAVVINNFVWPRAGHYETGGMGTYEERVPIRKRDVRALMKKWPGLFRVKDRQGFVKGTDLAVRLTSLKAVAKWRREVTRARLNLKGRA